MKKCENCKKEWSEEEIKNNPDIEEHTDGRIWCNEKCYNEETGRDIRGENLTPELMKEHPETFDGVIDNLISQLKFTKHLANVMENSPHRPNGKDDAAKYRADFAKLSHKFYTELMLAQMFGIGDTEGAIQVVDTDKLPSPEEAKNMTKEELEKRLKDAEVDRRMIK